jgi:outer membrane receptor protein involved in Fe transport
MNKGMTIGLAFRAALLSSALALPMLSVGAHAQDTAAPAQASDSSEQGGLVDIVVTARRREESLQDVPVSVTALSAEQIQKYDMTSLEKISTQTPQFTIGRASNGSGAQLTLRGIGSSSTSIGIEQSVAVVLDGVYYGQGRVINEGFLDLAGVEMLKGPQALFFGKNATAGVISIRTADPSDKPEFMGRVGYEFKAKNLVGEAIASGPLSNTLGIRIAVRASNMFGGYFNNRGIDKTYPTFDVATGTLTPHFAPASTSDAPGEKEMLGRVTLQWQPDDRLKVTLKANASANDTDNNSWNYVPFACANGTYALNSAIKCERKFNIYQNRVPADIAGSQPFSKDDGGLYNRYRSWAVTGTAEYTLDDLTLTWINNYNQNVNRWSCDCTFVSSDLAAAPSSERSKYNAFSSEFRAQTNYDGPVNLLAGVYYQSTKRNHTQTGAFGNVEDSSQAPELRYLGYLKRSETEGETISGYGQVTYKVVPSVEMAAGVRYTHETKDSYLVQPYVNALLQGIFLQGVTIPGNQTFNNWSPEATITWKPSSAVTVYGAYKTAYKSGGFSNSGFVSATTIASDVAFNPERARGFEGGIKTTLFDRQLRLNIGAYSYKYLDLQVDYFNSDTFAFITTNAGSAKTKGVELEFEYAPRAIEGFDLHGSLNYNRARYGSYIAPCYGGQSIAAGCDTTFQGALGQDLSGKATAVAPKWTGSIGASYETEMSETLKFGASVDTRYSGSYLASSFAHPLSNQPKYLTIDGSIRVKTTDDKYELAVIGKNLTNRFIVGGVVDAPNTGTGTGTAVATPADQIGFASLPRTVQLQLTAHF